MKNIITSRQPDIPSINEISKKDFKLRKQYYRFFNLSTHLGYKNISEFLFVEYYIKGRTKLELSRQLDVTEHTIRRKLSLAKIPTKPFKKELKANKPKEKVRWKFKCGCFFEGEKYYPQVCSVHGSPVEYRYFKCKCCKSIFKTKSRRKPFCPSCAKSRSKKLNAISNKKTRLKNKNKQSRTCSVPECNRKVAKGNRYLCNKCFKKNSDEDYLY